MPQKSDPKKPNGDEVIDAAVIRELASIIADSGLTEIEVERGELRIRVARTAAPAVAHVSVPAEAPAPVAAAPALAAEAAPAAGVEPKTPAGAVPSPMVGTVYLSPDPDSPPFVAEGQTVEKGQTLLLIEAMKTFNPITAPRSGKVTRIIVEDAQPVEYGEALVVIG